MRFFDKLRTFATVCTCKIRKFSTLNKQLTEKNKEFSDKNTVNKVNKQLTGVNK